MATKDNVGDRRCHHENCVETVTLCRGSFTLPVSVGEVDGTSAVAFRHMFVGLHRFVDTVIIFAIGAASKGANTGSVTQVSAR